VDADVYVVVVTGNAHKGPARALRSSLGTSRVMCPLGAPRMIMNMDMVGADLLDDLA